MVGAETCQMGGQDALEGRQVAQMGAVEDGRYNRGLGMHGSGPGHVRGSGRAGGRCNGWMAHREGKGQGGGGIRRGWHIHTMWGVACVWVRGVTWACRHG